MAGSLADAPLAGHERAAESGVQSDRLRRLRRRPLGAVVPEGVTARYRPFLHAGAAALVAARTTHRDRKQVSAKVVWLQRLQSDQHREAAGYLPRLLQLLCDGQGRENAGDTTRTVQGQSQFERHHLLQKPVERTSKEPVTRLFAFFNTFAKRLEIRSGFSLKPCDVAYPPAPISASKTPPATTLATCPAALAPMACISRKFSKSSS